MIDEDVQALMRFLRAMDGKEEIRIGRHFVCGADELLKVVEEAAHARAEKGEA